MKILIVRTAGNKLNYSNYNLQEIGLAKAFLQMGHNVDVVYYGGKRTEIQEIKSESGIIKLYWLKGISIAGNGIFKGLNKLLKQYDVIQVNDYDQLTSLYLLFFSKYRKKVVLYHGPYINQYTSKYALKCKVIDKIPLSKKRKKEICCFAKSELAKNFLKERSFTNITVTGVGLDIERFNTEQKLDYENFKELKDKFVLLFVGKIDEYKNILFALKIVSILKNKMDDIHLLVVGHGNADYEKTVERYIINNGLKCNVTWIKKISQDDMKYVYKISDALIFPTLREIFGMVMLESMYFGVPVITTYNGGSSTAIKNNENGFILPLEEKEWVKVIFELYNNEAKKRYIIKNAKNDVDKYFTWENIANIMLEKYRMEINIL